MLYVATGTKIYNLNVQNKGDGGRGIVGFLSGKASLFAQQDQVQKKQNVVWTDVPGETSTPLIISYIYV